ncbi:MAG: DHH family phosphoesterase [Minisyncoccales bacterium]
MEIKNLKKTAQRIKKAIKNKEKIILYGDADLDGATSVIILQDSIKTLGGQIFAFYFPDRETEGYGISKQGLKYLARLIAQKEREEKKKTPILFIALDCGISNYQEVALAKKMGFEVIIIDHHQILNNKLPTADIIVNPKQEGDRYSFKDFACVGIVFKLSQVLLGKKLTESLNKNFLELTALATIADMMPQEAENKVFIEQGLLYLEDSWRPAIRAFWETEEFRQFTDIRQKVGKIISLLNIRDVEQKWPASFRLLNCASIDEAKEIIKDLLVKQQLRREKMNEIMAEMEKRIKEKDEPIIFEGDEDFDLILLSSIASDLCQRYQKPVFLYKKMKEESHGTVRMPKGINGVDLMNQCSDYLLTYGGHPLAAGFRLKNKNLEKFKKCLLTTYEKNNYLY